MMRSQIPIPGTCAAVVRMLVVCFSIASASVAGEPLGEEQLSAIIASPHTNELTIKPLRIYPQSRKYEVTLKNVLPDGRVFNTEFIADEKWVDGKYIVSEAQPGGPETKLYMVVEYDSTAEVYRKYIIMNGKLTGLQVGIRVEGTRSTTWIDLSPAKFEPKYDCLTTEVHTDNTTTWTSIYFTEGRIQRTETGQARATER